MKFLIQFGLFPALARVIFNDEKLSQTNGECLNEVEHDEHSVNYFDEGSLASNDRLEMFERLYLSGLENLNFSHLKNMLIEHHVREHEHH